MGLSNLISAVSSRLRLRRPSGYTEEMAQIVIDNFAGLVVVGTDGVIHASSHVARTLLSSSHPLEGRRADSVLPAEMREAVRQVLADKASSDPPGLALAVLRKGQEEEDRLVVQYAATVSQTRAGRVACLNFWDVTERRRAEERMSFLATHDPLSGAMSRTGLTHVIHDRLATERGREEGLCVIAIDLARFKPVNEALGHAYGDMLLKQVVSRLRATGAAYVARFGGASFVVTHPGLNHQECAQFCEMLHQRLVEPYQLGPHRATIGAEIGFSETRVSGFEPDRLYSHADMALSFARASAKGFAAFSPDLDESLKARQLLETEMQQAMERGEISLVFQPQATLDDGRIVGVEALMRWMHPELGMVSPERFIPVAEETGKIVEMGRWILDAACREVATWPGAIRLSVNVSPIQFELVDVVEEIRETLHRSGLPAHRLDVEITEGIFMSNARAVINALQRLRDMRIAIALDDFGTGYSSLSYLGRLPVDKIKIDQSFVKRLPGDQEAGAIIRAVMMLSEALGKTVIAEGVETADQAWMLKMMGCKIAQGFRYGRPMTGAEMRTLLRAQEAGTKLPITG